MDADAEIITLVIETLRSAGLKDFQISIGHVEFFKSLITEAGIDEENVGTEEELRELISNKNMFGVEELLSEKNISEELKNVFATLPQLFGTVDALERAKLLTSNPGALKAIARLEELYGILKYYGVEKYVSFDLGMISNYMYYTGIIFRGYTFGTGDAIVKGGRYDHMMGHFGKDAPSIGFVVVVDQLLTALSRQKIDVPVEQVNRLILYKKEQRKEAITLAKHLRIENNYVELICQKESLSLEDYLIFARRSRITEILYFEEKDRILSVNTETKVMKPAELTTLLL